MVGMTAELWLVRHGETEWTCAGKFCGRSDPPLTDKGREDARALTPLLSEETFDRYVSSPSVRALETARLAYGEPETEDRLLELDFGELEGMVWHECSDEIRGALGDYDAFCAPGGESVAELGERVLAALRDLGPGKHLVVTHGGVIRFLTGLASGTDYPRPASLTRVTVEWSQPPRAFILG